jgi:hypothetical protein
MSGWGSIIGTSTILICCLLGMPSYLLIIVEHVKAMFEICVV